MKKLNVREMEALSRRIVTEVAELIEAEQKKVDLTNEGPCSGKVKMIQKEWNGLSDLTRNFILSQLGSYTPVSEGGGLKETSLRRFLQVKQTKYKRINRYDSPLMDELILGQTDFDNLDGLVKSIITKLATNTEEDS